MTSGDLALAQAAAQGEKAPERHEDRGRDRGDHGGQDLAAEAALGEGDAALHADGEKQEQRKRLGGGGGNLEIAAQQRGD